MPVSITLGGRLCVDAIEEARNLARLGYPAPPEFARANCLLNPRGEQPARGWFLLLYADLLLLDLNSLLTLSMTDDYGNTALAYGLVVAREPTCLTPSLTPDDPAACYLVEVADARWRCHNPYYSVTLNSQYNVRAPGWGGLYYAESLYAPTTTTTTTTVNPLTTTTTTTTTLPPGTTTTALPWTWDQMVGDIWWRMVDQLGPYPGLPIVPDGIPERFRYQGVSAWRALCQVLAKLGLAVAWLPSTPPKTGSYAIVPLGAEDTATQTLLDSVAQRKIFDRLYPAVIRGRVPPGVRVHFHRVQEHYGTEPSTAQDETQFITDNVYTLDVNAPDTIRLFGEPGVYHPLWDDLPAVYDADGNLLNESELQTRAQNRGDAYFAAIQGAGGGRQQQIYSGLVTQRLGSTIGIAPGSTIGGVCWRQDLSSLSDPAAGGGGLVTEIVTTPAMQLRVSDNGQFEEALPDSSALRPPDLRVKEPVWPDLLQLVRVVDPYPNDDGTYNAVVLSWNSDNNELLFREDCLLRAANEEILLARNYQARLIGAVPQGDGYQLPLYMVVKEAGEWVKVTSNQSVQVYLTRQLRTVDNVLLWTGQRLLVSQTPSFSLGDVGAAVTGTGIPNGTVIEGYESPFRLIMSQDATDGTTEAGEAIQLEDPSQNTTYNVFPALIQRPNNETGQFDDDLSVWCAEVNGVAPCAGVIYQCRLLFQDVCGNGIWATEQSCCSCGDATTTSTTTTATPCTGTCSYTWNGTSWTLQSGGCGPTTTSTTTTTTTSTTTTTGTGTTTTACNPYVTTTTTGTTSSTTTTTTVAPYCACVPPTFCGTTSGECTITFCGFQGDTTTTGNPCTTTTTTTSTTTTTGTGTTKTTTTGTTTTTASCCTTPCPQCTCYGPSCTGGGGNCTSNAECVACGIGNCTDGTPCGGGGGCDCICTVIPPPQCLGSCTWTCYGNGLWFGTPGCTYVDGCPGCLCHCDAPSVPCVQCGDQVATPCYCSSIGGGGTNGTGQQGCCGTGNGGTTLCPGCTTTTGTTTTTQPPCSGSCTWQCTKANGWNLTSNACTGTLPCSCCPPVFDCDQDCLVVETLCSSAACIVTTTTSTTTTTTTSTTTTTCYPCTTSNGFCNCPIGMQADPSGGQCNYVYECGQVGTYVLNSSNCAAGYSCVCNWYVFQFNPPGCTGCCNGISPSNVSCDCYGPTTTTGGGGTTVHPP